MLRLTVASYSRHTLVKTSSPARVVRFSSTFQTIPTCPSPTCACAPTPDGLDIDRNADLNGRMATYFKQVIILTGQDDWKSRVEEDGEDTAWGDFTRKLKAMTTRGGEYADPFTNNLITAGSFKPEHPSPSTTSALIFPDALLVQGIKTNDSNDQSLRTFISQHLQRDSNYSSLPGSISPPILLTQPTILICGHGGRDERCGVLGPLLKAEFERHLPSAATPSFATSVPQVGLISHIGGHKFAGNIIIYIPPDFPAPSSQFFTSSTPSIEVEKAGAGDQGRRHPLAGKGIWYGRVEPKHVEGIVRETIEKGNVIRDLFRGGMGMGGEVLRLPMELNLRPRMRRG